MGSCRESSDKWWPGGWHSHGQEEKEAEGQRQPMLLPLVVRKAYEEEFREGFSWLFVRADIKDNFFNGLQK